jgi:hypothetical protein
MYVAPRVVPLILAAVSAQATVRMSEETRKAFDNYIKQVESKMDTPALARLPEGMVRAANGEIVAVPFAHREAGRGASVPIPEGLINHWVGAMFVPGATVERVRAVLENYGNYSQVYAPEVAESKVLKSAGEEFDVFMRLHRQVRVKALLGYGFPVEFNAKYHIRYHNSGDTLQVHSTSTRIAQVKDPKKSHTEEYEPGNDDGYLWRLQSYWRVYPGKGGVFVECEAVSLSRSVPGFVEKMVTYFTTNFPEDSMRHTLKATRAAVQGAQ